MHVCIIKAKQILRRVEVRDLYNCVWKFRVPKMLTGGHDPAGDHHHSGHFWRAMTRMKTKSQGESIHALLDEDIKRRITVNNLWVEVNSLASTHPTIVGQGIEVVFFLIQNCDGIHVHLELSTM